MPAFNEERTIAKVIIGASKHVGTVVVIDDGSSDYTAPIAEKLGAYVIRHEHNEGKGSCLRDGFKWAKRKKVDVVVTLDADGQHDPGEIPKLLQPILDGKADIVIGSRTQRPPTMPRVRRLGQKSLDTLVRIKSQGGVVDSQSGYRAYSRKALDVVDITESGIGADIELLIKAAKQDLRIAEVPVSMLYGAGKTSKLNPVIQFSDVLSIFVKELIGKRPLRFLGIPGLVLMAFGIYGWLQILSTYNLTREFATGHALVYTILFLSGIFIMLGAIVLFVIRLMVQEIGR